MTKDFPCVCGHTKEVHEQVGLKPSMRCSARESYPIGKFVDGCIKYTPDNLGYFKQKFEELEK